MKILHISLASAYTEGMTYQDNLLSEQNVIDGHEVVMISDCHKFEDGVIVRTDEEDRMLGNGVRLIRIKYDRIINEYISGKIRKVAALKNWINALNPDVILYHGVVGWELLTVASYKKDHPSIKLYLDSHEDFHNSATNIISRVFQYRLLNRFLVKRTLPYVDKVFCVAFESFEFLSKMYDIPVGMMEFYPLGGIVKNSDERLKIRAAVRLELRLNMDDVLLMHSGKMDKLKRTKDILLAFSQVPDSHLRLILIGSMSEDVKEDLSRLIKEDNRIRFLGWKSGSELQSYLLACDLYVQPGGQSATMQNAVCAGCAVALYPHPSHLYLLKESVLYIESIDQMIKAFQSIVLNPNILSDKRAQSFEIGCSVLSYEVLAKRLYLD